MFGISGGIANFNRRFLNALASSDMVKSVDLEPRVNIPDLSYSVEKVSGADKLSRSKSHYVYDVFTALRKSHSAIICGHINLYIPALVLSFLKGSPLILIVHGVDVWTYCNSSFRKWMISRASLIVSVSEFTVGKIRADLGAQMPKTYILPNAVDLDRFTPGEKNLDLTARYDLEDATVILFIGRLDEAERYKGVDELIEILPALVAESESIKLVIGGVGNDLPRLRQKAQILNMENHIVFAGFVGEDILVDFYRLADVFAMPGSGEGFGIVYLEALACGIPVVGSLKDGSAEALMHGELGYLADPDSNEDIFIAIKTQLDKKKGRDPRIEYFSVGSFDGRVKQLALKINEYCHG